MSDETLALSTIPPVLPAQGDYEAICAAVMRTERGRWFLREYAKRNRHADTEVLLVAIQRIEAVVSAHKGHKAQGSFRSDLLEMAKAITRTRAEVAEIKPERPPHGNPTSGQIAPSVADRSRAEGVFAAAERIRDVTWAMRGHGFDPSVCGQLEELSASILSASSLRDPSDQRTRKLSEVLQYLELRIDTLLDGSARPAPEEDREAAEGGVEKHAGNGLQADDDASAAQAHAAKPSRPQSNDNHIAPESEPCSADDTAGATAASSAEQATKPAAAAALTQAREGEAAVPNAPPDDPAAMAADLSAPIQSESADEAVLQQAPAADPEAPMEQCETLPTLSPKVELSKSSTILLKPVADRAFPLISRESPGSLFLKGIETGAAMWDFGLPETAQTSSTVASVQTERGHADTAEMEQLPGKSIRAEGTAIESAQIELAGAEAAQAELAQAEPIQAESLQAELGQTDQARFQYAEVAAAQIEASDVETIQLAVTEVEPVDDAIGKASGYAQAFNSTLREMGDEPAPLTEDPQLLMPAQAAADAGTQVAPPVERVAGSARRAMAATEPVATSLLPPNHPLAALESMSDVERIAIFT